MEHTISLNYPPKVCAFIEECSAYDTRLSTVAERMTEKCHVPDLHYISENDGKPDPNDGRVMLWYDGEEHIYVDVFGKPRLTKSDEKNLELFTNALVAIRKLYSYRHKRNKSTPLLENNHALLLKIAIEFAVEKFNVERFSLRTLEWCVEESLNRNTVADRFIDDSKRRYNTKELSPDEVKSVAMEYEEQDRREKALRNILRIMDAGKRDATQQQQAEVIGHRGTKSLRKQIALARETMEDKTYMREHFKSKFTKAQIRAIRYFLTLGKKYDNGAAKRSAAARERERKIVANARAEWTVAQNLHYLKAGAGIDISLQHLYRIYAKNGVKVRKR